jgi:hypothetical protein
LAGEEAGDGDVFVERFPVEAAAADAELFALLRCGAEEAGGNQARGTPRVRPSLGSTPMLSASKRTFIAARIALTEVVIHALSIRPELGFSGYHQLIRAYVEQGLRKDLARLERDSAEALTASLRRRGVADEVIQEAIAEAGLEGRR